MTTANGEIPPPPPRYREPLSVGTLRLASRFNLAPLAGYTNLPFRLSVRELGGVGLCTTDLVNARAILQGVKKTFELLVTSPADRPLAVQIFGGNAGELAGAAKWLVEHEYADSIDINMGCPVRKVVKTGGGALAAPWFFRQLTNWVQTGDPGPRATYQERMAFMRLHLRRLVEWKGNEKYGCIQFRKVATWYTRALRLPKAVQQRLVMLNRLSEFEEVIAPYAESGPPSGWSEWDAQHAHVPVPAGPVSHW